MCKTCGNPVGLLGMIRGEIARYPHSVFVALVSKWENSQLFRTIPSFYTHNFTRIFLPFLSVYQKFYTVFTPLIITKTNII